MKRKFSWRGTTPPVLAMIALMLTLGVVGTIPVAYAKYTTSASITATGQVAKWSVWPNENTLNDVFLIPIDENADPVEYGEPYWGATNTYDLRLTDNKLSGHFKITINNEVATDIIITGVKYNGPPIAPSTIPPGPITISADKGILAQDIAIGDDYRFRFPPLTGIVTFTLTIVQPRVLEDPTNYGYIPPWYWDVLKAATVNFSVINFTAVQVD